MQNKSYIHILLYSIFLLMMNSLFGQESEIKVKGEVKDAMTGEPLIGATIYLKGTTKGTVSNVSGIYEVSADRNSVLVFSYVGYLTEEIPIEGRSVINISLSQNITELQDVVIVGYGSQKKESVIGAISTLKAESITTVPGTNITQSIAGRISGVSVVQPSGEIGNDEASIYIRGRATFDDEASKPLIVVDGIIRNNFAQIDPNEIESINILKDASATAVYGVKGANGVILVTTKRGASGKVKVNASSQYAVTQPVRIPSPLDAYRSSLLWQASMVPSEKYQNSRSINQLMNYRTKANPWTEPDINWVDEVMKDYSSQQQYNVNLSGGTNTTRYFVSGGFFSQDGFYKNDNTTRFNRYNFRSNIDVDITRNFSASLNLGGRIEELNTLAITQWSSWEVYHAAFSVTGREHPVYNPNGTLAGNSTYGNPVASVLYGGKYNENKNILEVGLNFKYTLNFILQGLAIRSQFAFDNEALSSKRYTQPYALYDYNFDSDTYTQLNYNRELAFENRWWDNNNDTRRLYGEIGLDYLNTFGKNSVSGLLLANRNFRDEQFGQIPNAEEGLVGRLTYDYYKRYFAEVNIGINGSENFAKKNRFGIFPAFSLGWMPSAETFYQNSGISKLIPYLKLRGSMGWVGNDRIYVNNTLQRFLYLQDYTYEGGATFGIGDTRYTGIRESDVANQNVTWETSRKLNLGLESKYLNGLFELNLDYFNEYRKDILLSISDIIPDVVGASFKPANKGRVINKGFEIEFKHNKSIGKKFSYHVSTNFSYAHNEIIEKTDAPGVLSYQKEAGYAIGTPLVYEAIGIFQSYEEIYESPSQLDIPGNNKVVPGDLKFRDINGDGIINEKDRIRTGYSTVPEIQYGVTVTLDFKNFDASFLFQGSDRAAFNKNWEIMWAFSNNDNVFDKHWYYWSPEITGKEKFVRLYDQYQNNEAGSTYSLGSGSYVRLKNIELGYTLPANISRKLKITGLRIYFSALNPLLWSKEPYLDPDNRNQRGGLMPPTKAYNFGVSINI